MRTFVLSICLLLFCLAPNEALAGSKIKFDFKSTPSGATVTSVHMDHNKKKSCVTPCKMKLRGPVEDILFGIKLEGYEPKILFPENAPIVDNSIQFDIRMFTKEEVQKEESVRGKDMELRRSDQEEREDKEYELYLSRYKTCDLKEADRNTLNREAAPCERRIVPFMPSDARESEWCEASFDVSEFGKVENINIVQCTNKVFETNTVNAIANWRYLPSRMEGENLRTVGVKTKVHFKRPD